MGMERFKTLTLACDPLEAEFAPQLGMAGVSLRHRGQELLDRRAGLRAFARTGAVMGVPLLYPCPAGSGDGLQRVAPGDAFSAAFAIAVR